jgi:dsDNA-specific endonuclease/ATPase MutS2
VRSALPCDPGSRLALCDTVLCDIGDSQSIAQNLSTFSGHMTRVIEHSPPGKPGQPGAPG